MWAGANFMLGKLTTNANFEKYKYSKYCIGFDTSRRFSLSDDNGSGENVIIFDANMSLSVHFSNKKKKFSFLVKVQRKG